MPCVWKALTRILKEKAEVNARSGALRFHEKSTALPRPNRIDVELSGAFKLHFITKNAVNDHSCRMVGYLWTKPVVGVCLFPYGPVFQMDHGPAGQSVKGSIDAAHEQIELGTRCDRRSFLCSSFFRDVSVAL